MGFLFRPIRTLILLGIVFVAGVLYERAMMKDRCLDAGGAVQGNLCAGIEWTNPDER